MEGKARRREIIAAAVLGPVLVLAVVAGAPRALSSRPMTPYELAEAREEIDQLERRVDRLHDSNDRLTIQRDDAYAYADEIEADVAARSVELDARQADIDARAAEVDAQVAAAQANTFGDGIHQVGRDIQPGQYHTDGAPGGCYYALLTAPSGAGVDHIIDNNNVEGPATLVIDSAYFESSGGCEWTKIG